MNDFWSSAFARFVLMFFSQPLLLKAIKCESTRPISSWHSGTYTVVSHLFQPSKSRQAEGESGRNIHHDLFSSRRPGSNSWINSTHWVLIKPAHVHSYETRGFFQSRQSWRSKSQTDSKGDTSYVGHKASGRKKQGKVETLEQLEAGMGPKNRSLTGEWKQGRSCKSGQREGRNHENKYQDSKRRRCLIRMIFSVL